MADFVRRAFEALGFAAGDSRTTFVFVNIARDAEAFRRACLSQSIAVRSSFPA